MSAETEALEPPAGGVRFAPAGDVRAAEEPGDAINRGDAMSRDAADAANAAVDVPELESSGPALGSGPMDAPVEELDANSVERTISTEDEAVPHAPRSRRSRRGGRGRHRGDEEGALTRPPIDASESIPSEPKPSAPDVPRADAHDVSLVWSVDDVPPYEAARPASRSESAPAPSRSEILSPRSERSRTEQPRSAPHTERPRTERVHGERLHTERPHTERPHTERLHTERPGTEPPRRGDGDRERGPRFVPEPRRSDEGRERPAAPARPEDLAARAQDRGPGAPSSTERDDGSRRRRRRRGGRRRRHEEGFEGGPFAERAEAPGESFEGGAAEREDFDRGAMDAGDLAGGTALEPGFDEREHGAESQGRGEHGAPTAEARDRGEALPDDAESASQRRRRRRRRRRTGDEPALGGLAVGGSEGAAGEGEFDDEPSDEALLDEGAPAELEAELAPAEAPLRAPDRARRMEEKRRDRGGRRHRKDRGDRDRDRERDEEDDDVPPPPPRNAGLQRLVINCVNEEESRVALVADGVLDDIQVNVRSQSSWLGNIYKGRIVNLEPSIGAAFVDFGVGRNGFLHVSDVMPIYGREGFTLKRLLDPEWAQELDPEDRGRGGDAKARLNITDFLKKGQEVLVQVTKDGIGDKGPTLTTFVSIPGRYLVLMPSLTRCGVSRKIEDERERRRLRRILKDIETPPGMGVIVRTAGSKRSKEEIRADLEYLMQLWKDFSQRLATGRAPKELYEESDVAIRTIRDVFTPDVKEIAVDDEKAYERIREFMAIASPVYVDRVKLYKGPTPIFHAYGVESQLEQLFARKVELPTGGSIVIDQAEALVAIDVNSGKSKESGDLEQTALRTNLAAIPEITRQMRLRDLGGIVVIDFIDMIEGSHRRQVERAFRSAISTDRARTKLARISQFGLLEMTRQRLGPGLKKTFFEVCPHCSGMGHIKTPEAQSLSIIRDIQAVLGRKGFQHLEVKVRPEVEEFLANQKRRDIFQLEERYEKRIRTVSDYRLPVGQVHFRFLSEDGREVRPGN